MKKDKPSKKKVKPAKIEEPIKQEENTLSTSLGEINFLGCEIQSEILSASELQKIRKEIEEDIAFLNVVSMPFKQLADRFNPFWNNEIANWRLRYFVEHGVKPIPFFQGIEKAITFETLVKKLYNFAIHCVNPMIWRVGTKKEIKEGLKTLKSEKKEIQTLLTELIPTSDTKGKKEDPFLRMWRMRPTVLVDLIDKAYKPRLRKYLALSYKGKAGKKVEDIKRYWEAATKKPFHKKIHIDDRTETTIALSILAYQAFCNYRKLADIYYKAKKAEKQSKNPF